MGRGYYIVEISSSSTHIFITAFNVEKPQSLIMELPEKQARSVIELFDHDFEQIATWLRVVNETKLVLLNPHFIP